MAQKIQQKKLNSISRKLKTVIFREVSLLGVCLGVPEMIGKEDGVCLTVTDQLLADRAVVGQLQLVIVAAVLHPKQTAYSLFLTGEGCNKYRK